MNASLKKTFLVIVCFLNHLTGSISAFDENGVREADVQKVEFCQKSPVSCQKACDYLQMTVLTYLSGNVGRGLGFDCSYSTVGFFLACDGCSNLRPFLDMRWHCLASRKNAANVGFGFSFRSEEFSREQTLSLYYDFRQARFANYNQLSLGFESLGCLFDFRMNAYYPLRGRSCGKKHKYTYEGGYYANYQRNEFSFRGVDAGVGTTLLYYRSWKLYAAAGPYYYLNDLKSRAFGGRVRFSLTFCRNVGFELISTFDSIFHSRLFGKLWISFPLYSVSSNRCCSNSQVGYPFMYRNDLIVLKERTCWDYNFCGGNNDCDCGCH